MVDFMTPSQRSRVMSRVRSNNTKIEQIVRSSLHRQGFRFRKNVKTLPGRPDLVLTKYQAVIFVHGCFWHGHIGCRKSRLPTTRAAFWEEKISGNLHRDAQKLSELLQEGWRVAIIWECILKKTATAESAIDELTTWLISKAHRCEIPDNKIDRPE